MADVTETQGANVEVKEVKTEATETVKEIVSEVKTTGEDTTSAVVEEAKQEVTTKKSFFKTLVERVKAKLKRKGKTVSNVSTKQVNAPPTETPNDEANVAVASTSQENIVVVTQATVETLQQEEIKVTSDPIHEETPKTEQQDPKTGEQDPKTETQESKDDALKGHPVRHSEEHDTTPV